MRRALAALLLVAVLGGTAWAVEPGEMLADPHLEARARSISEGLRCLVCQNESIDESHAELAKDIRLLVRRRLEKGDSDAQVRAFLVARYGPFILLRPPVETQTLLLWGMPLIVLALGGIGLVVASRRTALPAVEAVEPLDPAEQRRLREILAESILAERGSAEESPAETVPAGNTPAGEELVRPRPAPDHAGERAGARSMETGVRA